MSQSDQFDNFNEGNDDVNTSTDTYTTESSEDIYNTPDVVIDSTLAEEVPAKETPVVETGESTDAAAPDSVVPYNNQYGNQYNNQYSNQYSSQYNNNIYGSNPYGDNPYGSPAQQSNNPYGSNQYGNNQYGNNQYAGSQYGSNQYGNNQYSNNQYAGNQYGNNQYGDNQYGNNQYGNNQYGYNQYGSSQYGTNQYNNGQYDNNQYGSGPAGNPPYGNNQYSPYATPPKKNKSGLIIGIIVAIIVLFFVAICALIYRAMSLYTQEQRGTRSSRDEYDFNYGENNGGANRNQKYRHHDEDDYDDYDDDDYDDWYDDYDDWYDDYDDWYDDDYYYDEDSPYYEFHDDIRYDLSYSVEFDYEEYDTDNENVYIWYDYPIISGEDVPNLNRINDAVQDEIDLFVGLFEDEYADQVYDDDDYYEAYITTYVTYMDEEKMSIVFDERIYSDYYVDVYLYCMNIDMEHGVIMDNENILSIDDDFSVDFRERSDIQNGEISGLTMMSDQQMTKLFNSEQIIVFYTPMGMEIGFNYDEGWVTVTYEEYEQYLKVF